MFNPPHFREDRPVILHDLMNRAPLATLVTLGGDGIEANPIPLMLTPDEGPHGTLYGHVSRANPLWRETPTDSLALAVFTGPNGYVSPNWYPSKQQAGKVVPTWNYAVVHARGPVSFFDDHPSLLALVTRLTERHEAAQEHPWRVSDAPVDYIEKMLDGIVGVKLSIARLEGKWKMSQNRTDADRQGALDGLSHSSPELQEVAREMRRLDD